mmetsp:Transcript_184/g.338  ORF Transcript_184/g.338 Transcript_184/m.338 type:complete len:113 (+) Transcript_184:48-386(+)
MEPGSNIWNSHVWQANRSRTGLMARSSYHPSSTFKRRDGKAPGEALADAAPLTFAGGVVVDQKPVVQSNLAQSRPADKFPGMAGTRHPTEMGTWGFGPFYAPTGTTWLKPMR